MTKKVVSQCISADYCKGWNDAMEEMQKEIKRVDREHCKNCKHFIPCKELVNREWHWFNICDLFAHEKDGWAIVTTANDLCECFEDKEFHYNTDDKYNPCEGCIHDIECWGDCKGQCGEVEE